MTMSLQRYIDRRVASQLEEAFEEMMSTATGRRLAESSVRRRACYIIRVPLLACLKACSRFNSKSPR
jgi:hypothetical protein